MCMVGILSKSDGMRLGAVKGRELHIECVCERKTTIAIDSLLERYNEATKIKEIVPLLMCTRCLNKSLKSFKVV